MNAQLSSSERNPQKHRSDGDSIYLKGRFEHVLSRLSGIDAFENRGLNIDHLFKSGFLYRLEKALRYYLWPKLTEDAVETHKRLGVLPTEYLESILSEELTASFREHILDRHGRPLIFLSTRHNQESYNLQLARSGWLFHILSILMQFHLQKRVNGTMILLEHYKLLQWRPEKAI